jgi:hypothetical protein
MNNKRRECEVLDKQNSEPKYRVFTITYVGLEHLLTSMHCTKCCYKINVILWGSMLLSALKPSACYSFAA